jgi:hypothetical protein
MLCPMRRAAIVLGGVIAIAAAGAGWLLWPAAPPDATDLRGANLLLITIDTLRPDRLGAYGSRDGLTPALDALARRGTLFTRAWSHVPTTLPAHASISDERHSSRFRVSSE